MADDGFHEIQLGRKQLVFVFAATVVTVVVVFLIGVWVGRDIRRPNGDVVADAPTAEVTPDVQQPPTQVSPKDLDYNARVQSGAPKTEPKLEDVKPAEPPTPAAEAAPDSTAKAPAADASKKAPADAGAAKKTPADTAAKPSADATKSTETKAAPATGSFYVQVAAFSTKKPADTLMARLKKKSYDAYLVTEASGPSRFRVRVGPFADRAAAEAASDRLKKEEGLSPLVRR